MGIDLTSWKDIAASNKLFIAVSIVLFLIVLILLVRLGLERMRHKSSSETVFDPNKEQLNELSGIDIKPDEFRSEILEMKADFLAPAPLTTSVKQEAIEAPEPFETPQPTVPSGSMTAQEPMTSQELIPELDGYELEDELEYESPVEAASSPETEIPDTEEEMLEEEIDPSFEPEVTLPAQVISATPEGLITRPEPESKITETDEVKPEQVISATPEQQPEIKLFNFEDSVESKPEAPADEDLNLTIKEVEKAAEDAAAEPEIKLFDFEARIETKPVTALEQDMTQAGKEGAPEDVPAPEPEIKLFNFEAGMATKHKMGAAAHEKITSERKKASERKSLF